LNLIKRLFKCLLNFVVVAVVYIGTTRWQSTWIK